MAGNQNAGRKPKLTDKLIADANRLIKQGNFEKTVYNYVGVSGVTWYRWMNDGEKLENGEETEVKYNKEMQKKVLKFYNTIKKAKAFAEAEAVRHIQLAGKNSKHWQANAWYLERKYPGRWGKEAQIDNTEEKGALNTFLDTVDEAVDEAIEDETE